MCQSSFRDWRSTVMVDVAGPIHPAAVQDFQVHNSTIFTTGQFNSNNSLTQNTSSTNFNFTVAQDADAVEARKVKETLDALDKMLEPSLVLHARLVRHANLQVCYPGTREDILQEILSWIRSDSESNVLRRCICVVGVPGSGKSTIAATVVENLEGLKSSSILSAEFFIRRGIAEDPNQIFPTIAQQLSRLSSRMAHVIHQSLSQKPLLVRHLNHAQIDELFLAPLGAITQTVVIVIDALDELTEPAHIARFIAYIIPKLPSNVRLLLTTRNEHDILVHLEQMITKISLELRLTDSVQDVKHYITEKLRENLQLKFLDDEEWINWPTAAQIQSLCDHASGLFVWGATAVGHITQFVYDEGICGRDEALAEVQSLGMADLDALYEFILRRLLPKSNPAVKLEYIRRIIGLLVVAQVPLNLGEVCHFLGITPRQFDTKHFLQRARSLLVPGLDHIRIDDNAVPQMHKSFVDFITSPRANEFQIQQPFHHFNALRCALKSMGALHFNICNLQSSHLPNREVKDLQKRLLQIPAHVRYSCHHWSQHMLLMDCQLISPLEELKNFMEIRFLFWLEVLSLSGSFAIAARSMNMLAEYLKHRDQVFQRFVQDAIRFIASNAQCIAHSAPHIYISALPTSPSSSIVANHYMPQYPRTMSAVRGRKENWDAALLIIDNKIPVNALTYCPDGDYIASGGPHNTISVWDARTGDRLVATFEGHKSKILSLSFSPDGKRIVSGSMDCTLRIWDLQTGNLVAGPFEGHTDDVESAVFSPDGTKIVSGSKDKSAIVWNAATGQVIAGPLLGHTSAVTSVAFSLDGHRVISASLDNSVIFWDTESGGIVAGPFLGPGEEQMDALSIQLSGDGNQVASTIHQTIQIWDSETCSTIQQFELEYHWLSIARPTAFSRDGKYLAGSTGSSEKPSSGVLTLDLDNGRVVGGPFFHSDEVLYSVAFSPDGQEVVAGSDMGKIRVWDAYGETSHSHLHRGHEDTVRAVVFSPDGKSLISGGNDKTVQIWDAETGDLIAGPFEHTHLVCSLAISPGDGKYLAFGSSDGAVVIWSSANGQVVAGPCLGHGMGAVYSVALSPDGLRIASASTDKTVRTWNAVTGESLLLLQGHTESVHSVTFSPNGAYIASGSDDNLVRIWDANTGKEAGLLKGHEDVVHCVAFSPDGRCIISGSRTIKMWNVETGDLVRSLEDTIGAIRSVAFSPDGRYIVAAGEDDAVRIWDSKSGSIVKVLRGHNESVNSVQFSPDGTRIATAGRDKALRIWDISTLEDEQPQREAHLWDSTKMVDGWIMTPEGGLLFWVPPVYRQNLYRPSNTVVIGKDALRLDFSEFVHGQDWIRCKK
ncbi:quinon protein alcohol dehydrogenase-like superfamily [Mycena floridula]|nr:quinon protein alcohol dehydrogenase-like superfamily [Mycena floridula]